MSPGDPTNMDMTGVTTCSQITEIGKDSSFVTGDTPETQVQVVRILAAGFPFVLPPISSWGLMTYR